MDTQQPKGALPFVLKVHNLGSKRYINLLASPENELYSISMGNGNAIHQEFLEYLKHQPLKVGTTYIESNFNITPSVDITLSNPEGDQILKMLVDIDQKNKFMAVNSEKYTLHGTSAMEVYVPKNGQLNVLLFPLTVLKN